MIAPLFPGYELGEEDPLPEAKQSRACAVNVRRAKGWDVYVGPGACPRTQRRLHARVFGNPLDQDPNLSRFDSLRLYLDHVDATPWLLHRIKRELKGKTIACRCLPKPCHAVILAMLANGDSIETVRAEVLAWEGKQGELFG